MELFSVDESTKKLRIELALRGVSFSEEIEMHYEKKSSDEGVELPVYLLPVDSIDDKVHGFFKIGPFEEMDLMDKAPLEAPIGFSHTKKFTKKNNYEINPAGELILQDKSNDEVIYLPLQIIPNIKRAVYDVYEEEKRSFQILGVEGEFGLYPLMMVSETEEGLQGKGFIRKDDGSIGSYDCYLWEQEEEFRKKLRYIQFDEDSLTDDNFLEEYKNYLQEQEESEKNPKITDLIEVEDRPDRKLLEYQSDINWSKPKEIVGYLDRFVIGQDEAKVAVAIAFKKYMARYLTRDERIKKENMLLIGPSGVGKTYMIELLARKVGLPFSETKLTDKTKSGYIGENLSRVFEKIRTLGTGEAPYGIVFFDEIDKLARDSVGSSSGFGPGLIAELIGWLEEATILGAAGNSREKTEPLNTKNILFITAGAFTDSSGTGTLEEIIRKRIGGEEKRIFGFGRDENSKKENENNRLLQVKPEDLVKYGLKNELLGRLPALATLNPLTVENKVDILKRAEDSVIKEYKLLMDYDGYKLELDEKVLTVIAERCPPETGARALNSICFDLFSKIIYDPDAYAEEQEEGKIIRVTPDLANELITLY